MRVFLVKLFIEGKIYSIFEQGATVDIVKWHIRQEFPTAKIISMRDRAL